MNILLYILAFASAYMMIGAIKYANPVLAGLIGVGVVIVFAIWYVKQRKAKKA